MTTNTKEQNIWIKYLPKSWKSIISVIMILGVPVTPFVKSGIDNYMDGRIGIQTKPMSKTVDSLYIINEYRTKSDIELRKSVEELNHEVRSLNEWLIKNNKNNRSFGK